MFARHQGWYRQRVAVIGTPGDVNRVIRRLERHPELGLELCCVVRIETASPANGFIDLRPMSREDREPREARDLAAELVGVVSRADVNRVVIASSPGDMDQRSELIRALSELGVHVDMVSAEADAIPSRGALHFVEGLPMLSISVARAARSRTALKRVFDIAASALGLLVLSPFLVYCGIRIRLDSRGPVLFRQAACRTHGAHVQPVEIPHNG